MGIFSRFSDIVNSNINALLDKAENPEKMLRLMIQEMEETLVEVRTTSAKAIADKKELERRKRWLDQQAEQWQAKAEVALKKGREDLARAALVEKTKALDEVEALDEELTQITNHLQELNIDASKLQAKLDEVKARQKALSLRHNAAHSKIKMRKKIHDSSIEKAINQFDDYERRLDEIEGQVESYDIGRRDLAQDIAELEAQDKIDQELAKIKEKLNNNS